MSPLSLVRKVFSVRHRSKLFLPLCLLVVGVVWSSSSFLPFSVNKQAYLPECKTCGLEGASGAVDGVGSSITLQHKVASFTSFLS